MPAEPNPRPYRMKSGAYGIRYYDGAQRKRKSGFTSKSAARKWFRDCERPRMLTGAVPAEPLTLAEFADRYMKRYEAIRQPASVQTLRWRLARPLAEFGETKLADLRTGELAAWEATLPPRFRHAVMRALRQLLDAAVKWELITRNPAVTGQNPAPAVLERVALEPAQIDALAGELRSPYDVAVVVGAWCYLRPSELLGLERRDVGDGVLNVRGTKTAKSVRGVPLPARARQALDELPPRIGTRLLFPAPSGALYDRRNFGRREFAWARDAAGLPDTVTPYTLRHSGISWALAAGVPPSDVAKFGGTSVTMLELHYAHLMPSSVDAARERLDVFAQENSAKEEAAK